MSGLVIVAAFIIGGIGWALLELDPDGARGEMIGGTLLVAAFIALTVNAVIAV
ncbi:membrane protein [Gordonia phage LittleMunchkin]|nr:membrane protein [Gordonia phage LittleMunchkin]